MSTLESVSIYKVKGELSLAALQGLAERGFNFFFKAGKLYIAQLKRIENEK